MTIGYRLAVINQSTCLSDAYVDDMAAALTVQARHLAAAGFREARDTRVTRVARDWRPGPGVIPMYVVDSSDDVPDALGWHEADTDGNPSIWVLAGTALNLGLEPSVTASHELCETVADARANRMIDLGTSTFVAYETADPVEADQFGYVIEVDRRDGSTAEVLVSDFVTDDWFMPGSTGPFDYAGHCPAPLTLLAGGYIGVWTPGSGWQQAVADRPSPDPESRVAMSQRTPRRRAAQPDWTCVPWIAVPALTPLTPETIDAAPTVLGGEE